MYLNKPSIAYDLDNFYQTFQEPVIVKNCCSRLCCIVSHAGAFCPIFTDTEQNIQIV